MIKSDENEENKKSKLISNTRPLTPGQILNRRRLSVVSNSNILVDNDENVVKHIDSNSLTISKESKADPVKVFERARLSIVSNSNEEEAPVPDDEEPMKLVLEDQSVFYKESPIKSYLKSGSGTVISLLIFAYFFCVHLVRILSGKSLTN